MTIFAILVFLCFGLCWFLSFVSWKTRNFPVSFLALVFLFLMLIAGCRLEGKDRFNYLSMIRDGTFQEINFRALRWVWSNLHLSYVQFFLVVATISLGAIWVYFCLSEVNIPDRFLAISVFISNYFIIHECVQIRVGLGIAFVLIAVMYRLRGNFLVAGLFYLISFCCHYSLGIICIMFLLGNSPITRKETIISLCILFISACLAIPRIGIASMFQFFPIPAIQEKVSIYVNSLTNAHRVFLNVQFLLRLATFFFVLIYMQKISSYRPYIAYFLRLSYCGLVTWLLFSDVKIMALRLSEIFFISDLYVIPSLAYGFQKPKLGKMAVGGCCMIYFIVNVLHHRI